MKDEFDLAIRVGALADSALMARKLGVAAGGYYASPAYLARRGVPKRPRDLSNHDAIVIPRGDRAPEWHFVEGRRRRSIVVKPRLTVNGFELGLEAAVAGVMERLAGVSSNRPGGGLALAPGTTKRLI